MCNLYTMKLSRDEMRGLLEHYKLASMDWAKLFEKEQRGINDDGRVYPKYAAPVVIVKDGEERLEKMKWGMPGPVFPGKDGKIGRPSFITNVRNTESRHWTSWLAGTEVTVGKDRNASDAQVAAFKADRPLWESLVDWLSSFNKVRDKECPSTAFGGPK